jgi:hypothetical protein
LIQAPRTAARRTPVPPRQPAHPPQPLSARVITTTTLFFIDDCFFLL